ncbi:hypothetical protein FOG18_05800 [Legionella israelensis]|uniref:glycosyltransferase family 39 protein n=1 Tax=Legionella israelensis TaxID=454 RepID=UPI00117E7403|nr:glycosyltransferase family 39 protein [Legionella israelensis]QDP72114.1 hypothetical protein FOG18_05800 [Legionella israelensis]
MSKTATYTNLFWFGILTLGACLIRFILASQDISVLDRVFLPDDTFYTLSIARSMAMGLGPTVDGFQTTNGFQPLIAFLQLPIFYLGYNGDQALISAIFLSAFFGGLAVLPLGFLLLDLANRKTAIIGCCLWAVSPYLIVNDLNALETSLTGLLSLLILLFTILADREQKLWQWVVLGFCCGLAFLARVDTCFLLATTGFFIWKRWGWRPFMMVAGTALLIVTPWWIYCFSRFGTIIPGSGEAVKFIVDHNQMSVLKIIGYGLYTLSAWLPFFEFSSQIVIPTIILGSLLFTQLFLYGYHQSKHYGVLFIIPCLLIILFYLFYLPAFWFFNRYFYFVYMSILIFLALFLGQNRTKPYMKTAQWFSVGLIVAYSLGTLTYFYKLPILALVNGYRAVAVQIKNELHQDDILGAMQSGALGYYLFPNNRVINLDGVVNKNALNAMKRGNLKDYVNQERMTHYADWTLNINLFRKYYGGPLSRRCFYPMYTTSPTTNGAPFILYRYIAECH